MTSPVDIVNQALSFLGTQSQIQSLSENSAEALHASIHYDATRTDLLRKYNWGFARKQVAVALLKAAAGTANNPAGTSPQPPVPWQYEYSYPSDCLMARRILPIIPPSAISPPLTGGTTANVPVIQGPPIRFAVALDTDANGNNMRVILTNMPQAQLVYTADVTDPNIFDSLFQSAFVGRLCARLVMPLSGDKALAKIAIDDGEKAEADAAFRDGDEGLTVIDSTPDWIRGRGFASDSMWSGDMMVDPLFRIE